MPLLDVEKINLDAWCTIDCMCFTIIDENLMTFTGEKAVSLFWSLSRSFSCRAAESSVQVGVASLWCVFSFGTH